jgi:dCMP deaminase
MPPLIELDRVYLDMALKWARLSRAKRMQVGCLVVRDNQIISDGYNGTPSGFNNNCEDEDGNTKPEVLHAESNALMKLACSTQSSVGSTLYVTLSPCFDCSKLIIQAKISRVVFKEKYRFTKGIELLEKAGIIVEHVA